MPVRMQSKEIGATPFEDDQLCARGWQDYMLETCYYQHEAAVAECLRDLAPTLRRHLGLAPVAPRLSAVERDYEFEYRRAA